MMKVEPLSWRMSLTVAAVCNLMSGLPPQQMSGSV